MGLESAWQTRIGIACWLLAYFWKKTGVYCTGVYTVCFPKMQFSGIPIQEVWWDWERQIRARLLEEGRSISVCSLCCHLLIISFYVQYTSIYHITFYFYFSHVQTCLYSISKIWSRQRWVCWVRCFFDAFCLCRAVALWKIWIQHQSWEVARFGERFRVWELWSCEAWRLRALRYCAGGIFRSRSQASSKALNRQNVLKS